MALVLYESGPEEFSSKSRKKSLFGAIREDPSESARSAVLAGWCSPPLCCVESLLRVVPLK